MKKSLLVLLAMVILVVPALSFANLYGPSRIQIEKTWAVSGGNGARFELDGIFLVNSSYQRVVSMEKTTGAELVHGSDGIIKLMYNGTLDGSGTKKIYASAVVDVLYDAPLPADFSRSGKKLPGTNLTKYDANIEMTAIKLSDSSSGYSTIRNLVDWTNNYVEYDISYFGENKPAEFVFVNKKGVCVEYSHLLISLLNALGIENRYVAGYVYNGEWQPHAWVEVKLKNGSWLPLDPTFGEIQYLDNSHLAMFYGNDQNDIADKISAYGKVEFESTEEVGYIEKEASKDVPVAVKTSFDAGKNGNDGTVRVTLTNERPDPVFVAYLINMPKEAGTGGKTALFFKPGERKEFSYPIKMEMKAGYVYTIPIMITVNDKNTTIEVKLGESSGVVEDHSSAPTAGICGLSMFAIAFAGLSVLRRD
ncbi:MAG: transglutaminase domain-containing protein [Candidatus Micrarchaeia archaeon]